MARRVESHRRGREERFPDWITVEEPWAVADALRGVDHGGAVLIECLTLWMTNLLIGDGRRAGLDDGGVAAAVGGCIEAASAHPARVIVVTNEVGCGIVPVNDLARRYSDLLGEANQRVAAAAEEVYACWVGVPVRIKPTPVTAGV